MALILLAIPSSPALGGHYPHCFGASFLSQCLLHSSHTSAFTCMGSSRPCEDIWASMHACGTETAVERSCPNLYDSTNFLTCGCCFWRVEFLDVMEAEGGHAAPECNKLRPHCLPLRRVYCVLFWISIQAPIVLIELVTHMQMVAHIRCIQWKCSLKKIQMVLHNI